MRRILGIDLGSRRIGLAVADAARRHRPPARDGAPRDRHRRRRRGDRPRLPRAGASRSSWSACRWRPAGPRARWRPAPARGRRPSASAWRSPSRSATSASPRSRPSGGSVACPAAGPAARPRGPSATPSGPESIARRRASSSRTSSTHAASRRATSRTSRTAAAAPDDGAGGAAMSIRGGRGPRDDAPIAGTGWRPAPERLPADRAATGAVRATSAASTATGTGRRGSPGCCGSGSSSWSWPPLVLVALLTIARPIARLAIVPLAENNPAALRIGFLADLVREDLGSALTAPAPGDGTEIVFAVNAGDTPATLAPRLAEAGIVAQRAGVPVPGPDGRPRRQARRRRLRAGRQPDPGRGGEGPGRQPDRRPDRERDVPRGPADRADGGQAADDQRHAGGRQGVLRPRHAPDRRVARRLPVAAGRRPCGPRAARSRASCTRPPTRSAWTRRRRRPPRA